MSNPPSGSELGLAVYYAFDEGQGLIAHDATPNQRDTTLATQGAGFLPTWDKSPAQGIDLNGDGITANASSPRQGPNDLASYPIVVLTADGHLRGWLSGSVPGSHYHLEFFASAGYAPGGAGQAETYLGSLEVTTDAEGHAIFDVPYNPPAGEPVVTATATDRSGDTSELSARRHIAIEAPIAYVRVAPGSSTASPRRQEMPLFFPTPTPGRWIRRGIYRCRFQSGR